jgi:hypothetical protein
MNIPNITTTTLVNASATGGSFTYDMRGANIASLQLNGTLSSGGATDVITLTISNDNVNFVGFSTAKTVTFTQGGTVNALFELGVIDYAFLKVSAATPSAGNVTLTGVLYCTPTYTSGTHG